MSDRKQYDNSVEYKDNVTLSKHDLLFFYEAFNDLSARLERISMSLVNMSEEISHLHNKIEKTK